MTPERRLTIALIHNLKPQVKDQTVPEDHYSECDSPKTIEFIAAAIRSGGHTVLPVEADRNLPQWLNTHSVDLAFNIAEGFKGESREARIPALLELLDIPYTGSGVLSCALALDKAKTKQIFRYNGIPTPNFQLFQHPNEPIDPKLKFPLIVKPNREGSAKGIFASSVVHDQSALTLQVKKVFQTYAQEVLVEEYVDGKELTVGMIGPLEKGGLEQVFPVLEIDFSECNQSGETFYSWRMKEFQGNEKLHLTPRFWCPARLDAETTKAVQTIALKSARVIGCRDIARADIRLSSDGIPYVLEVNPLPGLDPEESNLPLMAKPAGMSYEGMIQRLIHLAIERSISSHSLSTHNHFPSADTPRSRELPDSMEKESGLSGTPAIPAKRTNGQGSDGRTSDPKEQPHGR